MVGRPLPLRASGTPRLIPMLAPRTLFWTNIALFQAGWFACVLGAARGMPWVGPIAVAAVLAWHASHATHPRRELVLAAITALVGIVFETAMARLGYLTPTSGVLVPGTAAYWLVALWVLFATTFNVSLRSLRSRLWLGAAFGAVGGPLAYVAGARLGALAISPMDRAVTALAVGWAVATPALLWTARRLDGYGET